jgi:hypothetical protein
MQNGIIVKSFTADDYIKAAELESLTLEEAWSAEAIAETVKTNGSLLRKMSSSSK